jgi:hypothetical protein
MPRYQTGSASKVIAGAGLAHDRRAQGEGWQLGVRPERDVVVAPDRAWVEVEVLERQRVRLAEREQRAQAQHEVRARRADVVAHEARRSTVRHEEFAHDLGAPEAEGEARERVEVERLEVRVSVRREHAAIAGDRELGSLFLPMQGVFVAREEDVPLRRVGRRRRDQQPVIATGVAQQHRTRREAPTTVGDEPLAEQAVREGLADETIEPEQGRAGSGGRHGEAWLSPGDRRPRRRCGSGETTRRRDRSWLRQF